MNDTKTLEDLAVLMIDVRWQFQVLNLRDGETNSPIVPHQRTDDYGHDIQYIYVIVGNKEYIVVEDESDKIQALYKMIESW